MQMGKVNLPCGCAERKEIIFEQGNWDSSLTVLAAVMAAVAATTYVIGRKLK